MKKLTSKVLDRLIREVIEEQKHVPFKSDYERDKHLQKQQEEAEARREKKKELRPDYDLMKLAKGIISEGDLLAEPDDEGYVKVKADALQRMLTENNNNIEQACNKHSYYKINQILDLLNRLNLSEKGDLYKKK